MNQMKKCLFALTALALVALSGCSSWDGDPTTQEFSVDGTYTVLQVMDAFDVTVSDAVSQVTVTAGEKIMTKVRVEKNGDKLEIYLKGWTISHSPMKVLIPANPDLKKLNLSGASDFHGDIDADNVEITLSGASEMEGNVHASTLKVTLSGASEATLEGQAGKLTVAISGSSEIEEKTVDGRYALACDECTGSISGSSDVYIHCDGNISVDVSGSSELHYTGNATTQGSHTSGSSSITHDAF